MSGGLVLYITNAELTCFRGINAGSKQDQDDLCAALSATRLRFDDIIDRTYPFEEAEEAIDSIWQGKVVGKIVMTLDS